MTNPIPTPPAPTGPRFLTGGLAGLQASDDDMAQRLAFEVNTGRAPEAASAALRALGPTGLSAFVLEARAAEHEAGASFSLGDFLRAKFPPPVPRVTAHRVLFG